MGKLTPVEVRLGNLLRQGLTNKEIGREVGYSMGHTRNRLKVMMEKTETENRVQLAVFLERQECRASLA